MPHQLKYVLPQLAIPGTLKVRMMYDADTLEIEYAEYQRRRIETLQAVCADKVDYSFKFEDRSAIHDLMTSASSDDIIMVKKGMITDSSYANLALWDGSTWSTPKHPLLKGIKRRYLIAINKLMEREIPIGDILYYEKLSLINAMLDIGDLEISTSGIEY